MKKIVQVLALAGFASSAFAAPGDDYVRQCTPKYLTIHWHKGYTNCQAPYKDPQGMEHQMLLWGNQATETMNSKMRLVGQKVYGGTAYEQTPVCDANIPLFRTETRPNGEECSNVPKQPFPSSVRVSSFDCIHVRHNGVVSWEGPAGATAEYQLDPYSQGAFQPTGQQFEFRSGQGTATFRVRLTKDGQTGSWAYTSTSRLCLWDNGKN